MLPGHPHAPEIDAPDTYVRQKSMLRAPARARNRCSGHPCAPEIDAPAQPRAPEFDAPDVPAPEIDAPGHPAHQKLMLPDTHAPQTARTLFKLYVCR